MRMADNGLLFLCPWQTACQPDDLRTLALSSDDPRRSHATPVRIASPQSSLLTSVVLCSAHGANRPWARLCPITQLPLRISVPTPPN